MNTRDMWAMALLVALAWPVHAIDAKHEFLQEHFPDGLFDATGAPTTIEQLKGKAVGIYFSAHWCPACRIFTPSLINFREANKKKFEVVFVSSDRNAEAQMDYMAEVGMPWLTMAWRSPAATNLSLRYSVRGIPRLVLLKPNGELFSEFGREFITAGGSIDELLSVPQEAAPLEELVLDSTTASLLRLSRARRWSSLTTSFSEIPQEERVTRWGELVKALQTQAADRKQGLLLTPGDIIPLMQLLETAPDEEQCAALAKILSAILKRGFLPDYLVAELEKQAETPSQREVGWHILRSAGLLSQARRFLPSVDESKANGDWEQVRLWLGMNMKAGDPSVRAKAGELIAWMVTQPSDSDAFKALPLDLALAYLSSLEADACRAWLTEHQHNAPLISTLITQQLATVSAVQAKNDLDKRHAALALLKLMIDTTDLSVAQGLYEHLNLYLHAWLTEANTAITKFRAAVQPRVVNGRRVPGRPATIKPSILVDMLPRDTAGKIGPELQDQLAIARIRLKLLEGRRAGILEVLPQLQKSFPDATANFCDEMLKAWSRHAQPRPPSKSPNRSRSRPIPMTRAQQVKALDDLAGIVAAIHARGIAVSDTAVVQAFVACHSRAEVYRSSDIEAVFGPPEKMSVSAVSALTKAMLAGLQQQWNKPELQAENMTNREEIEIIAEVDKGYQGLQTLLNTTQKTFPGHPDVIRQLANLHMAYSVFQQAQERELSVYTANRDRAFEAYAEACAAYETLRKSTPETALSVATYLDWFRAIIGVQQLALPSGKMPAQATGDERDASKFVSTKQLEMLRAQLFSLAPPLRDAHVEQLGQQLASQFVSNMPAHQKARFGEAALDLMHSHPSVERIRQHLDMYAGLLNEVQLMLALDGSSNIGSDSFGVFVTLQHSIALAREGGYFNKYLMNKAAPGMRVRGAQADYRQRFERNIHRALSEAFEVESLTFAESSVQPHPIARAEWSETPMAYLRLKAKEDAVDRVPSIQIDLDFIDSTGQVVLPVTSNTLLVNARADAPKRPAQDIQVEQVLDDRKLTEDGRLRVEIHLSGFGVLPELKPLLESGPNYHIKSVHREMSDISRLEIEGGKIRPLSEAAYRLDLEWTGKPGEARNFSFPSLEALDAEVTYKRYDDVDIVAAAPAVILAGSAPVSNSSFILIGVLALLLLTGVIWYQQRSDVPALAPALHFAAPANPSPLNVLSLLSEIREAGLMEGPELQRDIQAIEEANFSPTGGSSQDLAAIAASWCAKANRAATG